MTLNVNLNILKFTKINSLAILILLKQEKKLTIWIRERKKKLTIFGASSTLLSCNISASSFSSLLGMKYCLFWINKIANSEAG